MFSQRARTKTKNKKRIMKQINDILYIIQNVINICIQQKYDTADKESSICNYALV